MAGQNGKNLISATDIGVSTQAQEPGRAARDQPHGGPGHRSAPDSIAKAGARTPRHGVPQRDTGLLSGTGKAPASIRANPDASTAPELT
jgi:hypothetical protein